MVKYCPIAREQCKADDCMFWSNQSCVIVNFCSGPTISDFPPVQPAILDVSKQKLFNMETNTDIPQKILAMTSEELANDITKYIRSNDYGFKPGQTLGFSAQQNYLMDKGCGYILSIDRIPIDFRDKLVSSFEHVENKLNKEWDDKLNKEEEKLRNLKEKTDEQLANELVEFSVKQFGEIRNPRAFQHHFYDYWKANEIDITKLPADLKGKISKIQEKAVNIMERSIREEQQNKIAGFVDMCLKWAQENGIAKVTLADIDGAVAEKNIVLLPDIRRMCQSRVNNALKTQ